MQSDVQEQTIDGSPSPEVQEMPSAPAPSEEKARLSELKRWRRKITYSKYNAKRKSKTIRDIDDHHPDCPICQQPVITNGQLFKSCTHLLHKDCYKDMLVAFLPNKLDLSTAHYQEDERQRNVFHHGGSRRRLSPIRYYKPKRNSNCPLCRKPLIPIDDKSTSEDSGNHAPVISIEIDDE